MDTIDALLRTTAKRGGFKPQSIDFVKHNFAVIAIFVGVLLIVVERAFTEYKRRRNDWAKINLEKLD